MSKHQDIVSSAITQARKILEEEIPQEFTYHNLEHTLEVVEYGQEIGRASGLSQEELEIILIACWFHDTGFSKTNDGHEIESQQIAKAYLSELDYPEEKLSKVISCIGATHMEANPENLLEQVICDADLYNLGKKKFLKRGDLLRQEWKVVLGMDMTDLEWYEKTIEFLAHCQFYTNYAQVTLGPGKEKNYKKLKNLVKEIKEPSVAPEKAAKNAKKDNFGRGVETMFRTTSRNHIQLSAIADNKANIMLSINAIIISIVVSVLVPRFSTEPYLLLPTMLLLLVCVLTIIFATISTIPKVTRGVFSDEDIANQRANLLFFGNFHNMELNKFEWGVSEMMKDRDFLYGAMTRDLYFLGKVLNRKYKYLRFCYNVFMYGLVLALTSFFISYYVYGV